MLGAVSLAETLVSVKMVEGKLFDQKDLAAMNESLKC